MKFIDRLKITKKTINNCLATHHELVYEYGTQEDKLVGPIKATAILLEEMELDYKIKLNKLIGLLRNEAKRSNKKVTETELKNKAETKEELVEIKKEMLKVKKERLEQEEKLRMIRRKLSTLKDRGEMLRSISSNIKEEKKHAFHRTNI